MALLRAEVTAAPAPPRTRAREAAPATFGDVLLVGSSGGHLAQLMALEPWWTARERSWVTFPTADATSLLREEDVAYAHYPTTRNVPNLVKNFAVAWRVLRRRRPDVIVSTGAAVAIPFFVIARLLRIPTVYVEVYDRVESRTVTGRICRPLASRFLVQWPGQQALYRGSDVVGRLL